MVSLDRTIYLYTYSKEYLKNNYLTVVLHKKKEKEKKEQAASAVEIGLSELLKQSF